LAKRRSRRRLKIPRLRTLLVTGLIAFALWAVLAAGRMLLTAGAQTLGALWLLPGLVALNLLELFMSAEAWGGLLLAPPPGRRRLYPLRIVREGIDSLMPVAQVGGEVVGAQLLSRGGLSLAESSASVVVDVTIEFLMQIVFLLAGLLALAATSPAGGWEGWASAALLTGGLAALLLVAQRFGVLRIVEAVAQQIAARWPGVGDLSGMHRDASVMYRRLRPVAKAAILHLGAWFLGALESWAVLSALGLDVGPVQALIVESLGMGARSAGFAIPGALVVQETGFALAAAAAGLPESAGLSLSLVKRVREVAVGLLGLCLWWVERRRTAQVPT
jgi:putative membrane protein